jgi:hypothetical protein
MTDIVEQLKYSAFKLCGKGPQEDAASDAMTAAVTKIARLQAGLMKAMQYDNKCDQTGKPCSDACGCRLEAQAWCDD